MTNAGGHSQAGARKVVIVVEDDSEAQGHHGAVVENAGERVEVRHQVAATGAHARGRLADERRDLTVGNGPQRLIAEAGCRGCQASSCTTD